MCGIAGFSSKNSFTKEKLDAITALSKNEQFSRGPDNFGFWIKADNKSAFFHNRLSLVDLSHSGDQPMRKHNLQIVFNGEIYNFREIKKELESLGYSFHSTTDTEVILSAYDAWGKTAFKNFNGAYALAIFDLNGNNTILARDKVGEKPLYYAHNNNEAFYFSSTISLLQKMTEIKLKPNYERILSDLIFNFWSDKTLTHFENIFCLPPGHIAVIDKNINLKIEKYWDLPTEEIQADEKTSLQKIENILLDATKIRSQLDTSISSILSGGIDSSLISEIAQKNLDYKLDTFTLEKFGHQDEDIVAAEKISKENNWNHHRVQVREEDISVETLKKVTKAMEEPVLDQVFIYINRNYEEVRKNSFKATLNGQGSDEIFLGYLDYYSFLKDENNFSNFTQFSDFWYKNFELKEFINKDTVYKTIQNNLQRNYAPYVSSDKMNSVLRFGTKTHMPALLMQEDKQSMAWSVEVRTVYTDYRLVSYLSQIPSKLKIADGREKYLLREMSQKYLPQYIIERKKLGFPNLPDGRDKLMSKCIEEGIIQNSIILHNLFSEDLFNNLKDLPVYIQWRLCSIAIFETIFIK